MTHGLGYRLRNEIATSWRSWVSLALLTGILGGLGLACLAGARRTSTAYPRFVREQAAFDMLVGGGGEGALSHAERLEAVRNDPAVIDAADVVMLGFSARLPAVRDRAEQRLSFPSAITVVDPDFRAGVEINRAKILEGRLPDPTRAAEAAVPFTFAERYDVLVGDQLYVDLGFEGATQAQLEVVGITAAPGDFEAVGQQTLMLIWGTPALFEQHRELFTPPSGDFWNVGVRLRDPVSDAAAFRGRALDLGLDVPTTQLTVTSGVQRSMGLYASALWVVGGLVALATIAIFGPASSRLAQLASRDDPLLRSLGMSSRGVVALALLRSFAVGGGAGILAGVVAVLASGFFPIGVARIAEPALGIQIDPLVVAVGAAAILVMIVGFAVPSAIRSARRPVSAAGPAAQQRRRSPVAAFLGRSLDAPAAGTGVRMAFEPGRGDASVPVRSTILAVAGGIAAVVLTLIVGTSLQHLVATPALAGFTYDAIVPGEDDPREEGDQRMRAMQQVPGVDAVADGTAANVTFKGVDSFLVAYDDGPIDVAMIGGSEPTGSLHDVAGERDVPEIALGPATMRRLGVEIGDVVRFGYQSEDDRGGEQAALVVGSAAVPALPWAVIEPGEGAVMSLAGLQSFLPEDGGCCFVRFDPDADPTVVGAEIQQRGLGVAFLRGTRADLVTLQRLSGLPSLLIAIFSLMGCAALAHVLLSAVRRRRRDVAILKTLGFVRRQVAATIAWQASAIALACVLIGVPAGIGLGRWGWRLIAAGFGVVPVVRVPVLALVLAAAGCVLVANVIAFAPARIAARTEPATTLRTE